ncbi:MAG: hypothetical protein ACYTG0_31200, partial [Planctomycetota bacterium]
ESTVTLDETMVIDGRTESALRGSASFRQQALMRMNFGLGRWLYRNRRARWINGVAGVWEVHYTTTLQDADMIGPYQIANPRAGNFVPATTLAVGNPSNRTDVVNMVAGIPVQVGQTTIYNGFVFPVSEFDNRGFDFEYGLIIDRRF